MATTLHEIDVIRSTRAFLQRFGLQGRPVLDVYTDAHPTLLADTALRPFQRFTLSFDGFAVHPDLVGRLADGETTFAVEAKGTRDLITGIAQAEIYRNGFHVVLLASAGIPSRDLLTLARQRDVGVLAVFPDRIDVIDLPPTHLPQLRHAESIRKQFGTTDVLSRQFVFNLPTHYLCLAPVLREWYIHSGSILADIAALERFTRHHYPELPKGETSFRAVVSGAEKLGIVRVQGSQVQPTYVGTAVADLLPDAASLADIHRQIKPGRQTLATVCPTAGAVLRCLLYSDPVAKFIIDVLRDIGVAEPVSLRSLVLHSAERDKILTASIFFTPESAGTVTDDQGQLAWHRIQPRHFRSTLFYQYKSILKHAGVLAPHRLGTPSAAHYDPDADIWELAGSAAFRM